MSPPFRLLTLVPLILLGLPFAAPLEQARAEYVRSERVALRMDHGEYRTNRPLDPRRQYEVEITSPYTLRPLLDYQGHCQTYHQGGGFFSPPTYYKICRLPLLINGELVPTLARYSREVSSGRYAAYFLDPDTSQHYVPILNLVVWGTGRPLTLQSTVDFSNAIPTATVDVVDIQFRHEQVLQEAKRRRQEEVRTEQARQAAERARKDQEKRERIAFLRTLIIPGAAVVVVLVIGVALARKTSPARERARVARLGRQIEDELKVLAKTNHISKRR